MLLDIALVTQTLINLIDKYLTTSPEKAKVTPLTVSALPPDKLSGDHTVGLYLYHITEDPQYKNLPAPGQDDPPVRFTPMGLNLYYLLTGHSGLPNNTGPETEQTMVGLAAKVLRDYPVIDDSTEIAGAKVFPTELKGTDNRFRIVLQPVQHNEAMTYWTAGSQALRLALYYQVSVVLLEPEKPKLRAGRVLKYGVFTFTRGAPHLDGSRSVVSFTPPGGTLQEVEVQPAEVPITGQLVLFGSDLAGDLITLLLKNRLFVEPIEVGTDWGVVASDNEIFATVQAFAGPLTIVPGMYSAIAKVTDKRTMPDKTVRLFTKTSNETPFTVAPRITAILPPDLSQRVVVQGGVFQDAKGIAGDAVEVFVGPQKLVAKGAAPLNPGEFEVLDAGNLRFRYPVPGVNPGAVVPLRLIINGAESAPNWVTAP